MNTEITRRVSFGVALAAFAGAILSIDDQGAKFKGRLDWSSLQLDTDLESIKTLLDRYKPDDLISDQDKESLRGHIDSAVEKISDVKNRASELLGSINFTKENVDLYNRCNREIEAIIYGKPPSKDLSGMDVRATEFEKLHEFLRSDKFPLGYSANFNDQDSDTVMIEKIIKLNKILSEMYRVLVSNRFFKETNFALPEAP